MRSVLILLILTTTWSSSAWGQECSGGAKLEATDCGGVSFEGCCEGEILFFCEGGMLCRMDCGNQAHCGWSAAKGFYDCSTGGSAEPSGTFGKTCEMDDPCGGLDGKGCCDGSVVRWCDGASTHSLDCSENATRTKCGIRDGVVDCTTDDAPAGPSCEGGEWPDVVTSGDGGSTGPVIHLDAVAVPDIPNTPSTCSEIGGIYQVESTDCGVFSDRFGLKQRGCAAVLVDLVAGSEVRPEARITKSGISFSFLDAGKTRTCTGEIKGDSLQGECSRANEYCAFTFRLEPETTEPPAETDGGGSGGCAAAPSPARISLLFLLIFCLLGLRRPITSR